MSLGAPGPRRGAGRAGLARFLPDRLFTRLALATSSVLVAAVFTFGWVTSKRQEAVVTSMATRHARAIAEEVAGSCAHHLVLSDYAALDGLLLRLLEQPDLLSVVVCKPDGAVVSEVRRRREGEPVEAVPASPRTLAPPAAGSAAVDAQGRLVVWHPIEAGTRIGWTRVVYGLAAVRDIRRELGIRTAATAAIWTAVAILVMLALLGKPARDIARLSEFARGLSQRPGSFVRVTATAREVTQLAESLNDASRELREQQDRLLRDVAERQKAEAERRELEAAFQQAQKLESIGRLAGGVAHDFNNLLTAILGNVELVLADLDPKHPARDPLAEVQQAAQSASALTRQLLAVSRKSVVEPELLDLGVEIEGLARILRRMIGEDVVLAIAVERPLVPVRLDRSQLGQILMNLAVNARDAMPEGGRLEIAARRELVAAGGSRVADLPPGEYVVVAVTDTGSGMTEEVKKRLFEPFFTTKELGKGTGLGLATVYGTARQVGGAVEVESEVGKGSTFRVWFPRATLTEREAARLVELGSASPLPGDVIVAVPTEPGSSGS